jgi:hypothetical protein
LKSVSGMPYLKFRRRTWRPVARRWEPTASFGLGREYRNDNGNIVFDRPIPALAQPARGPPPCRAGRKGRKVGPLNGDGDPPDRKKHERMTVRA